MKLSNPDKLILAAKESLMSKKFSKSRFPGMFRTAWNEDELDIMVTPHNFQRALHFMDALIKVLRKHGNEIHTEYDKTYVLIGEEKLQISLREKTKMVQVKDSRWPRSEYRPTGLLYLKVARSYPFAERQWTNKPVPLEDLLPQIIQDLETKCVTLKQQRLEWEKQRMQQDEEELLRREIETKRRNELQTFKALLVRSERWHRATKLRSYIAEIEQRNTGLEKSDVDLKSWISWAKQKADWYDPFIETEDPFLKGVNQDSLMISKTPSHSTHAEICNLE